MKKLFSLILVVCMVMTACAAFAESATDSTTESTTQSTTESSGLSDKLSGFFSNLSGNGEGGSGLSEKLSGFFSSLTGGEGGSGLSEKLSGFFSKLTSGEGGSALGEKLSGFFSNLTAGGEDGAGLGSALGGFFGNLTGGSEDGAGLGGLLGGLFGADADVAATEIAAEAAAVGAEEEIAAEAEAAAEGIAAEEELTAEELAELEALMSMFKEAAPVNYIKAESAEQFYGTWKLKDIVMAGYTMDMSAVSGGESDELILTLTADTYETTATGGEAKKLTITASELKDGAWYVTTDDGETDIFKLTDAGELCLIYPEEEGETAPTYFLFVPAA